MSAWLDSSRRALASATVATSSLVLSAARRQRQACHATNTHTGVVAPGDGLRTRGTTQVRVAETTVARGCVLPYKKELPR